MIKFQFELLWRILNLAVISDTHLAITAGLGLYTCYKQLLIRLFFFFNDLFYLAFTMRISTTEDDLPFCHVRVTRTWTCYCALYQKEMAAWWKEAVTTLLMEFITELFGSLQHVTTHGSARGAFSPADVFYGFCPTTSAKWAPLGNVCRILEP